MNNHEKVKQAINQLIEKQAVYDQLLAAQGQMENKLNVAAKAIDHAKEEVLRQMHNVCPGKRVVHEGREYSVGEKKSDLQIDLWDGVIL